MVNWEVLCFSVLWNSFLKTEFLDFPGGPVVKTELPTQRVRVRSPVGELRSHVPPGEARK